MSTMRSTSNLVVVFVFCVGTLLATSTLAIDSFGFLVEPRDTQAVQGELITLYCSVNQEADTVMWVRDTAVISQNLQITGVDDASRYSISYDGLAYNLIIDGVVPDDAGSYKCVAFSGGTGVLSRTAELEVSSPPLAEYPTITSNIASTEIAAGETVEIICEIEGGSPVPEIELVKDGETLVVASGRVVYVWVTEASDDGAVLECRAVHPLWSEARVSTLGPFSLVTDTPRIVLAPSSVEIESGGSTSFVCSASSAPRASYRWFINDVEIVESTADSSVIIDSTISASLLHLRVSKDTSGVVRCAVEATNGEAWAESSLVVIVTELSSQRPSSAAVTTQPIPSTQRETVAPSATPTITPSSPRTPHLRTAAPSVPTAQPTARRATEPSTSQQSSETASTSMSTTSSPTPTSAAVSVADDLSSSVATPTVAGDTDEPSATDSTPTVGDDNRILGASSFDTIFVITVSTIVSLIIVILIGVVAAFCVISAKRRRSKRASMYGDGAVGETADGDVFFRSRYISIVRSWFSPVHRNTQNTLTSFEGMTPDQSPYNTINGRR